MKIIRGVAAFLLSAGFGSMVHADTISVGGTITQSSQDGTGPAFNNPSLNNIVDSDAWRLSLAFDGTVIAPGTYNSLPGATLTIGDATAGAIESDFGFTSLTIAQVGGFDQFSLFGCLNTGGGCFVGNQISVSFQIAATDLNSFHALAVGLDQQHPLDLLEDDGTTDIQGSITSYSYAAQSSPVPEPSALSLLGEGLVFLGAASWNRLRLQ